MAGMADRRTMVAMDVTADSTRTVRVLIVDDQQPFRSVARTVIGMTAGFEVAAEAESGEAALARGAGARFDGNRGHGRAIVEVDIGQRVVRVVIAPAVDVVILHEQHHGHAGIGKNLAVGIVERAARIVRRPHLAIQVRMLGDGWQRDRVGAALAAAALTAGRLLVPSRSQLVPNSARDVGLVGPV